MVRKLVERRDARPLLKQMLAWSTLLAWLLFLIALVLFHYARPEIEIGLMRYFNLPLGSEWLFELKSLFLYTLWACCGLTAINVAVNLFFQRRRTDHIWFNGILLLTICVVSLLFLYL